MAVCVVCGNDYDRAFTLTSHEGESFIFDSFECAIARAAPQCVHCGIAVIGHGVQAGDEIYCCAHCARQAGAEAVRDRA
ncbi:MAG: hypothetical protein ACRDYU_05400 [Actinomycetes bacterium]